MFDHNDARMGDKLCNPWSYVNDKFSRLSTTKDD